MAMNPQAELDARATAFKAETEEGLASGPATTPAKAAGAWEEFFRLGDTLAATDSQESGSLTAAVLAMRR